jgi:hypothetical protein
MMKGLPFQQSKPLCPIFGHIIFAALGPENIGNGFSQIEVVVNDEYVDFVSHKSTSK